eukprot:XP_001709859.1 Hypothetical protein GL50803_36352 [Giardia lamblia ATCC 50803]
MGYVLRVQVHTFCSLAGAISQQCILAILSALVLTMESARAAPTGKQQIKILVPARRVRMAAQNVREVLLHSSVRSASQDTTSPGISA